MWSLYISIVVLLVVNGGVLSAPKKDCDRSKFDEHSANCFAQFGLDELKFPTNPKELADYCKKVRASIDYSKQYGKNCLRSTVQTLMALASYNFDVVNKPYCAKKGKMKDKFVSWSKCGNTAKKETKKCWDTMMPLLGNILKVKEAKHRMPIVCCAMHTWTECTKKAIKDTNGCTDEMVEGYVGHLEKSSTESMQLVCGKYDYKNEGNCKDIMKNAITTPLKKYHKTPLLYIFDVFDKM